MIIATRPEGGSSGRPTFLREEIHMNKTLVVTVKLTVTDDTDEHLQTIDAVADEVRSWLEDMGADVDTVTVTEEEERS